MKVHRANPAVSADQSPIAGFVDAPFRCAFQDTFFSLRAFDQADRSRRPLLIGGVWIDGDTVGAAERAANRAANSDRPALFAPPIATFQTQIGAATSDVANEVAISIDLDHGGAAGNEARLEYLLGPCTLVLAPGGESVDPATGDVHDELHLHCRLPKPTRPPRLGVWENQDGYRR